MFQSKNKTENEKRYEKICSIKHSVLDKDIIIEGEITSSNPLVVYGKVFGVISSTSSVEIDLGGEVHGTVNAKDVIVRGLLDGEVECNNLKVLSGAVLKGKTRAYTLMVEPKAEFQAISQVITEKDDEENILAEVVENDALLVEERDEQKSIE